MPLSHEGLYFISADALPLSHFFLQFSAWFRVPLPADYAFFSPLSAFHTQSFMSELMHTTPPATGCWSGRGALAVPGTQDCFLYSEMENQFAITWIDVLKCSNKKRCVCYLPNSYWFPPDVFLGEVGLQFQENWPACGCNFINLNKLFFFGKRSCWCFSSIGTLCFWGIEMNIFKASVQAGCRWRRSDERHHFTREHELLRVYSCRWHQIWDQKIWPSSGLSF